MWNKQSAKYNQSSENRARPFTSVFSSFIASVKEVTIFPVLANSCKITTHTHSIRAWSWNLTTRASFSKEKRERFSCCVRTATRWRMPHAEWEGCSCSLPTRWLALQCAAEANEVESRR